VDGDAIDGVVIEGKGNQPYSLAVTQYKTVKFMASYGLKRSSELDPSGGPRMYKSVTSDLNAIVDLWNAQRSHFPEWMRQEGAMDHPRLNNPALANIMKDYQQKEKERRDARVRNQTGTSLIDGEQYTLDQHRQVCEFGLRGEGMSRASRSDEYEDAMMRTYHLCGDEYLQRSEGRAEIHLRDAHLYVADESEGDQQMQLLVHHEDRSKTNQGGLLVRHGAARQRNDPLLDLSFHFGLFMFIRFVVKGYVPRDWNNRQEVVDWLEEHLFHAVFSFWPLHVH